MGLREQGCELRVLMDERMKMRQGIVERRVSELVGWMRKKEDASRTSFDEVNNDVQRLYNQSVRGACGGEAVAGRGIVHESGV